MSLRLEELSEKLGLPGQQQHLSPIRDGLDPTAPMDWRNLAALLARSERARVVGISGGQGTGKSTLARLLARAFELAGHSSVGCSLDDFYLSRSDRKNLAERIHPLLATRGVPGTHDVRLALRTLDGLASKQETLLPIFDKGVDDLRPRNDWRSVPGPVSRVVFEGWCLGVPPEPPSRLGAAVNQLEALEDADGRWRHFVNQALTRDYPELWNRVDYMIYLQAPDFPAVTRWRTQQEQQLPVAQRMNAAALERFLAHYQRLTLWMQETLPKYVDLVVKLDVHHTVVDVVRGPGRIDS
jgi:D-glycerate 3-kinase